LDAGRNENHRFFPYLTPIRVIDVVAFIEDNEADLIEAEGCCKAEIGGLGPLFI
jgi:hypothetical protein